MATISDTPAAEVSSPHTVSITSGEFKARFDVTIQKASVLLEGFYVASSQYGAGCDVWSSAMVNKFIDQYRPQILTARRYWRHNRMHELRKVLDTMVITTTTRKWWQLRTRTHTTLDVEARTAAVKKWVAAEREHRFRYSRESLFAEMTSYRCCSSDSYYYNTSDTFPVKFSKYFQGEDLPEALRITGIDIFQLVRDIGAVRYSMLVTHLLSQLPTDLVIHGQAALTTSEELSESTVLHVPITFMNDLLTMGRIAHGAIKRAILVLKERSTEIGITIDLPTETQLLLN